MDRVPRGIRPLLIEYMTIGQVVRHEKPYYNMTKNEFISCCMFYSNGYMDPKRAGQIYTNLMIDAGLPELESSL